jgi:hypothetical protein
MYPKSYTHESAMLPWKTAMQELKQKHIFLTLHWALLGAQQIHQPTDPISHTCQTMGIYYTWNYKLIVE